MSEAILIFTFTPIQSFIAEARRAQDLFMGSRILSEFANAAGQAIGESHLVYPADLNADAPNILVTKVPLDQAKILAEKAEAAIQTRWKYFQRAARTNLSALNLTVDPIWEQIWLRQTKSFWQIFWAAAPIVNNDYPAAYNAARDHLEAIKRSRLFDPSEAEEGRKDSLSGKRAALHTQAFPDARRYWAEETDPSRTKIFPSKVRPGGQEMLDAIGAVKRFATDEPFLSTSTVASFDYLIQAYQHATEELRVYREAVEYLLGSRLIWIGSSPGWPYDGDLLYKETLTKKRLHDDYGLAAVDEDKLKICRDRLADLYQKIGAPPLYYAILVMDGDGMGARLDQLLKEKDPAAAHHIFSQAIAKFSSQVPSRVTKEFLIYNGGDDVLCMLPLGRSIPLAQQLAALFQTTTGNTASAGLAIVHHQAPLDASLEAARQAEHAAKQVPGKSTLCVHALKRSGAPLQSRCPWGALQITLPGSDSASSQTSILAELIQMFQSAALSARFAADVAASARTLTHAGEMWQSELKRLISRHRDSRIGPDPLLWSEILNSWSAALPEPESEELAHWLILARFLAQGGRE